MKQLSNKQCELQKNLNIVRVHLYPHIAYTKPERDEPCNTALFNLLHTIRVFQYSLLDESIEQDELLNLVSIISNLHIQFCAKLSHYLYQNPLHVIAITNSLAYINEVTGYGQLRQSIGLFSDDFASIVE